MNRRRTATGIVVPGFQCHHCHHGLGRQAQHFIFNAGLLLCARCVNAWKGSSRAAHAHHCPDCPDAQHDMWDHFDARADRIGAHYVLERQQKAAQ